MKKGLLRIAEKLEDLAEKQPKVYKDFYTAEIEYAEEYNKLMMTAVDQFPNQILREAYVKNAMMATELFGKYQTAKFEFDTLVYQTRAYQTIARLLQSDSFRDYATGGGV